MVSRKNFLPSPTSPPPPPPLYEPWSSRHAIDSSSVPPIPASLQRPAASTYRDEGNPWADNDQSSPVRTHRTGGSNMGFGFAEQRPTNAAEDVPDVMKAGWSGQNTPRSSIDSQRSKDFWEDSDDEEESTNLKGKQVGQQDDVSAETPSEQSQLPIRRKPVRASPEPGLGLVSPTPFKNNNPFRRKSSTDRVDAVEAAPWPSADKGKGKEAITSNSNQDLRSAGAPTGTEIPDLSAYSNKSVFEDQAEWTNHEPIPQHSLAPPPPTIAPPPPPVHEPPPIPTTMAPSGLKSPSISLSPNPTVGLNPWAVSSESGSHPSLPISHASAMQHTASSSDLLDRDEHDDFESDAKTFADRAHVHPGHTLNSTAEPSLLDDLEEAPSLPERKYRQSERPDEYMPPPGPPPSYLRKGVVASSSDLLSDETPPVKPPRPAIITTVPTEQEIAQMNAQRSETYHVKHFNWFDQKSGQVRSSSMLLQNKNGPCPLLALVNALILGATDHDQALLDEFLRVREQVTLGTIIENLMMELLSRSTDGGLPDVDELNRFLLKLTTGMNMNPKFVRPKAVPNLMDARNSMLHLPTQQPKDPAGSFETSKDIKLYSSFGIATVHGWLPEPNSTAAAAFTRSAPTYEDAQAKLFGEDELEYKLSTNGLTQQEQAIWEDIVSIKLFLNTYQSQLTPYGLRCIQSSVLPGEFAILFRNDHFSTVYRRPQDGKLYTLVTDAGFADKEEIWQSLVDTTGQASEFYSGEFKNVTHGTAPPTHQRQASGVFENTAPPLSPQEQSDADFAMALQLQLEEEEEEAQRRRRAQSQSNGSSNQPSGGRRSELSSQEIRPLMPPRNARSNNPTTNRPADTNDADAPPAYEEAARGKPYNPPIGSPLHPQSSPTPDASPFNSSSQVNLNNPGPSSSSSRPNTTTNRRQSAYAENTRFGSGSRGSGMRRTSQGRHETGLSPAYDFTDQVMGQVGRRMPGAYSYNSGPSVASGTNGNVQVPRLTRQAGDRDRDCSVM